MLLVISHICILTNDYYDDKGNLGKSIWNCGNHYIKLKDTLEKKS
jgi:hypothetical protein